MRDRDDHCGAPVFPSRSGVRPQPEINASGNDQWDVRHERRESGDSDGVRRVRVHDVDTMLSNRATESPRCAWIDLAERIAVDDSNARFDRASCERFVRTRRDDRSVSATRELASEPERLTLSASPATLRVDMQHAQSHGAQLPLFEELTQGHG